MYETKLKMALKQFVSGFFMVTILLCQGCLSQALECGMRGSSISSRIVGGEDASPGDWPWQIALYTYGTFQCGGSLITDQWVLTAAHCIMGSDVDNAEVHLGVNNLGSDADRVIQELERVVCHPDYDSFSLNNDICLLKLVAPVNFTDYIQPVCLASENSTFYDGDPTWITGFGITDLTLEEVEVPIVGNKQCQCNLPQFTITDNMLCAGLEDGGKDSCQGDSGGPQVVQKDSMTWVQAGVVSNGEGCGFPMKPGVYTRVSQYQEWIRDTVTGMSPGFVTYMSPNWDRDEFFFCSTYTTPYMPYTYTTDDSIFGSGENLNHFTHFISLSVLALLLHVFVERGGM
ncbi:mast cell tryptase-like [Cololabis saira]|uniref:mast cell tryptase-like n=1 Tax=Cololabis saira TaxID=129043 RepID=UPI002AD30776|nr:mast cell tryptase-like [Cololabis saira]